MFSNTFGDPDAQAAASSSSSGHSTASVLSNKPSATARADPELDKIDRLAIKLQEFVSEASARGARESAGEDTNSRASNAPTFPGVESNKLIAHFEEELDSPDERYAFRQILRLVSMSVTGIAVYVLVR